MKYLDFLATSMYDQYNFDCCNSDQQKVMLNLFLNKK